MRETRVRAGQYWAAKYEGKNGDLILGLVKSVRSGGQVLLDNLLTGSRSVKDIEVLIKRNAKVTKAQADEILSEHDSKGRDAAKQRAVNITREPPQQVEEKPAEPTRMVVDHTGAYEILTPREELRDSLERVEWAGRTCYQSNDRKPITQESAARFCRMLIARGHESVLEHTSLTVRFTGCSRGFTHELVRHRLCAFSQESTRYVDYIKDGQPMKIVAPPDMNESQAAEFLAAMEDARRAYARLRTLGLPPEDARQVLPTALVSEIVVTANWREWRHIFEMRCDKPAHWEIRRVMVRLLEELQRELPGVFDDFHKVGEHRGYPYWSKYKPKEEK